MEEHACLVIEENKPMSCMAGSNLRVPVFNWRREVVGEHTLPGDIFNVPIRKDILHRVVRWQLAKRQQVDSVKHAKKWDCQMMIACSQHRYVLPLDGLAGHD